jgi:hypothetical protein
MTMIKYLGLLSVLAAFPACGQLCDIPVERLTQLPNDTSIVASDTAFLPLAVGNEWTYVNAFVDTLVVCVTTITRKVIKEDSLTYFEMVENYRGYSTSWLLRYRNPYEIEEFAGGERKLY